MPNVQYTYYWETAEVSVGTGYFQDTDFTDTALTGTFTLAQTTWPNYSGTVTRTAAADGYTEGTESFQLKIGPAANNLNNAGNAVTISDTSTGTAEPQANLYPNSSRQDYNSSFVEISNRIINSQTYMGSSSDYNGPYDVCDVCIDGTATGTRRVYIGFKCTHSTTYYNDVPIAGIQHLDPQGTTIKNSWIFWSSSGGSGSGWTTTTGTWGGSSTVGSLYTPSAAATLTYSSIGTGANTTRFTWATSTSSYYTGCLDGINSSYVTTILPAPNGSVTNAGAASAQNALVSQATGTYYAYVECSGITRYNNRYMRSPAVTVAAGDIFRVVHACTSDNSAFSTGGYNINDTLYFGIH